MAKPVCKTCGGELAAVVVWVHERTPNYRHPAEPEPVQDDCDAEIIPLVGRPS